MGQRLENLGFDPAETTVIVGRLAAMGIELKKINPALTQFIKNAAKTGRTVGEEFAWTFAQLERLSEDEGLKFLTKQGLSGPGLWTLLAAGQAGGFSGDVGAEVDAAEGRLAAAKTELTASEEVKKAWNAFRIELGKSMLPGLLEFGKAVGMIDAKKLGMDVAKLMMTVAKHMPTIIDSLAELMKAADAAVNTAVGFKEGAVSAGQGEFPQVTGEGFWSGLGGVAGWAAASPAFVASMVTGGATSRHLTGEGREVASLTEDAMAYERWLELAETIPGLEEHAKTLKARNRVQLQVVINGDIITRQGFEDRVIEGRPGRRP